MQYSCIFAQGSHGICHIHIDRHLLFKCCLGKRDLNPSLEEGLSHEKTKESSTEHVFQSAGQSQIAQ